MKNTSVITKTLALFLALTVTLAFTGCGDDVTVADGNTVSFYPEPSNIVTPSSSEPSSVIPTTSTPPVTSPPPVTSTEPFSDNIFDYSNEDKLLEYIKKYENGKKVHILMWRPFTDYENSVIKDFENSTGVKVLTTVTTEETYKTKLISLISQNNAPDVAMFSSKDFPGSAIRLLEPLNSSLKYGLYDECLEANCWQKTHMRAYRINNKFFGVTMALSWLCADMNYVTYYNTEILKKCGVTKMPFEIYGDGKWNWQTQKEIITKIADYNIRNGTNYTPYMTDYYDTFMLSAGEDFAGIDMSETPYKCVNELGNTLNNSLVKAWSQINQLYSEKLVENYSSEKVYKFDTVGLYTGNLYNACKDSGAFDSKQYNYISAVPVAGPSQSSAYNPIIPRAYGTPHKAKEPDLGIMFIRYLLGFTRTYSSESMGFCNGYLGTVGMRTMNSSLKAIIPNMGVIDYTKDGNYKNLCNKLVRAENQSIESILNSNKSTISAPIERINKDFQSIKFN